jgi:hypothetical protein
MSRSSLISVFINFVTSYFLVPVGRVTLPSMCRMFATHLFSMRTDIIVIPSKVLPTMKNGVSSPISPIYRALFFYILGFQHEPFLSVKIGTTLTCTWIILPISTSIYLFVCLPVICLKSARTKRGVYTLVQLQEVKLSKNSLRFQSCTSFICIFVVSDSLILAHMHSAALDAVETRSSSSLDFGTAIVYFYFIFLIISFVWPSFVFYLLATNLKLPSSLQNVLPGQLFAHP